MTPPTARQAGRLGGGGAGAAIERNIMTLVIDNTACQPALVGLDLAPESIYMPPDSAPDERVLSIVQRASELFAELGELDEASRIVALNMLRSELHSYSPFAAEPVDCIQWVSMDAVRANDYNPNTVAPPEMVLLEHSIAADGYTQPIVAWQVEDGYEVVDGFHRNRVGRENATIRERIHGYLPLAIINAERVDRGDRIAATIRHNRARGKHRIDAMSEIVLELKRRNWSDAKIGKELGMDPDEVLRLAQITGLAEMFADREFSEAWEAVTDLTIGDDDLDTRREAVE